MKRLTKLWISNSTWLFGLFFSFSILISFFAWGLSSPAGSSPDDDFHLVSIWCGQGNRPGICELGENGKDATIPRSIMASPCFAYSPDTSGACQGPNGVQQSNLLLTTDRGNFTGMYPRGFYWVMSQFVSQDVNASVIAMRLFNSALFTLMSLLLFWFSPLRKKFKISFTLLIALVPLGLFIVPSTNPSSWGITSACIFLPSLIAYFYQNGWKKWGLGFLSFAALIVGISSRADAAIYALIALLIVLILNFKFATFRKVDWIYTFAIIFVSLIAYFSAGQSSFASNGMNDAGANTSGISLSDAKLLITNLTQLPLLWTGALGQWGLGWLDTKLPGAVWVSSFFVYSAVIFWAVGGKLGKRNLFALIFAAFCLVAVPSYLLVRSNAQVGSYIQPRYILPLLIITAVVAIVPDNTFSLQLSTIQQFTIVSCLSIANSFALHTNIRRYTVGEGKYIINLNSNYEWWWQQAPSPMVTWLLGSIFFAVAVAIATTKLFTAAIESNLSGKQINEFN